MANTDDGGGEPRVHPSVASADPAEYNIETIARLEEEALVRRTAAERVSDAITGAIGSMFVVVLHVLLFVVWAVVNTGLVPGVTPFDPFPFGILTLVVSSEGVFLAIFILIRQNRMSRQADRRMHLSLQVSMLAEQELTLILRMQQRLCEHFGVDVDQLRAEAQLLEKPTDVEDIVRDLDDQMPDE